MKTTILGTLSGLFLLTLTGAATWAQDTRHIARNACAIAQGAERLGDVIEATMHGSIFENRLHHDAAEIFRVAERIEGVAERNGNVRQMEGDAKLLSIIVERMERTLTEAVTFAIRNPHHRGSGCRTHVVQGHLAALCQQVAHLRRDLETLCQASARPRYETRYETRYRPSLDWEAERYEAERNEARGWPTNRPYGFEQEIYQPRSWSPTYEYPQTRTQVIPNGPAPGGITLGNGRFSIQFGR